MRHILVRVQNTPKYVAKILNKVPKLLRETLEGWKSMLQRLRIYFAWNPVLKGIEFTSLAVQVIPLIPPTLCLIWLNLLCYQAGGFYVHQSRIQFKIYLKTQMHILSVLLKGFASFLKILLAYWSVLHLSFCNFVSQFNFENKLCPTFFIARQHFRKLHWKSIQTFLLSRG